MPQAVSASPPPGNRPTGTTRATSANRVKQQVVQSRQSVLAQARMAKAVGRVASGNDGSPPAGDARPSGISVRA